MENADIQSKLKLYFIMFAIRRDLDFHASAGYIFAYDEDNVRELICNKYGPLTRIRSIAEIDYEEGTILYGERWYTI